MTVGALVAKVSEEFIQRKWGHRRCVVVVDGVVGVWCVVVTKDHLRGPFGGEGGVACISVVLLVMLTRPGCPLFVS